MNLAVGLWSLRNKCNNRLPSRRSDHVSFARLFKAGAIKAYPFSVAAATVDFAARCQPSLPRLKPLCDCSPGFSKPMALSLAWMRAKLWSAAALTPLSHSLIDQRMGKRRQSRRTPKAAADFDV